jgi:hypothetical protein
MIFLLFLASVATLEVILRHDGSKKREIKPPAATLSEYDVSSKQASESVLALMNTLDQHGRGTAPAMEVGAEVTVSKNTDQRVRL